MSSNRAMLEALRQLGKLRIIAVGTERPAAVCSFHAPGPGQGPGVARPPLPDPIDQDIADLERKIRAFRGLA